MQKQTQNNIKKFWAIKAKEEDATVIDLSIYGEISDSKWYEDDITPKLIKDDLDKYPDAKTVNIYINSGGGSVFAGLAIYNMLERHKAEKVVYVDGLAASAASVIAMAGNKIIMPANAMIMIHKAWTLAIGNSDELLKVCETLERVDANLVDIYSKRTNQSADDIKKMLQAETWLDYKEAVALGFCDEIEEEKQVAASIKDGVLSINGIDVKAEDYKNFPILKARKVIEIQEGAHKNENKGQNPVLTGDDIKNYLEEIKNAKNN